MTDISRTDSRDYRANFAKTTAKRANLEQKSDQQILDFATTDRKTLEKEIDQLDQLLLDENLADNDIVLKVKDFAGNDLLLDTESFTHDELKEALLELKEIVLDESQEVEISAVGFFDSAGLVDLTAEETTDVAITKSYRGNDKATQIEYKDDFDDFYTIHKSLSDEIGSGSSDTRQKIRERIARVGLEEAVTILKDGLYGRIGGVGDSNLSKNRKIGNNSVLASVVLILENPRYSDEQKIGILNRLDELLQSDSDRATHPDFIVSLMHNIAVPERIDQGAVGTCTATSIQMEYIMRDPVGYMDLAIQLSDPPARAKYITLPNGNRLPATNKLANTRMKNVRGNDLIATNHKGEQATNNLAAALVTGAFMEYGVGNTASYDPQNPNDKGLSPTLIARLKTQIYGEPFTVISMYQSKIDPSITARDKEAVPYYPDDASDRVTNEELAFQLLSEVTPDDPLSVSLSGYELEKGIGHELLVTNAIKENGKVTAYAIVNPWGQREVIEADEFMDKLLSIHVKNKRATEALLELDPNMQDILRQVEGVNGKGLLFEPVYDMMDKANVMGKVVQSDISKVKQAITQLIRTPGSKEEYNQLLANNLAAFADRIGLVELGDDYEQLWQSDSVTALRELDPAVREQAISELMDLPNMDKALVAYQYSALTYKPKDMAPELQGPLEKQILSSTTPVAKKIGDIERYLLIKNEVNSTDSIQEAYQHCLDRHIIPDSWSLEGFQEYIDTNSGNHEIDRAFADYSTTHSEVDVSQFSQQFVSGYILKIDQDIYQNAYRIFGDALGGEGLMPMQHLAASGEGKMNYGFGNIPNQGIGYFQFDPEHSGRQNVFLKPPQNGDNLQIKLATVGLETNSWRRRPQITLNIPNRESITFHAGVTHEGKYQLFDENQVPLSDKQLDKMGIQYDSEIGVLELNNQVNGLVELISESPTHYNGATEDVQLQILTNGNMGQSLDIRYESNDYHVKIEQLEDTQNEFSGELVQYLRSFGTPAQALTNLQIDGLGEAATRQTITSFEPSREDQSEMKLVIASTTDSKPTSSTDARAAIQDIFGDNQWSNDRLSAMRSLSFTKELLQMAFPGAELSDLKVNVYVNQTDSHGEMSLQPIEVSLGSI